MPNPRKPTELRILEGNPGKRPIPQSPLPELPAGVPDPPLILGDLGTRFWALYWDAGRAWLAMTDVPMVARLCAMWDTYHRMRETIHDETLFRLDSDGRSWPHPLVAAMTSLSREMQGIEGRLGLSPVDRARINAMPGAEDPLDDWEKKRGKA